MILKFINFENNELVEEMPIVLEEFIQDSILINNGVRMAFLNGCYYQILSETFCFAGRNIIEVRVQYLGDAETMWKPI